MELITAYNHAEEAHDVKKGEYKTVLCKLASAPLGKAKTERSMAELLLVKAEVGDLKKKMNKAVQAVFQLYDNFSHRRCISPET